jgi:fermentation-respiration switch protein FrsA (DUF1100 family)
MRWLMSILVLCGCLCGGGCATPLFYHPDQRVYRTPDSRGLEYEDVVFTSKDGTRLHGWFLPARGDVRGTVVHCHGNAQNITAQFGFVDWLPAQGFNVFTFDYRGYGRSEGEPGKRGLLEDCEAALTYVKSRPGVDPSRLFLFGQSLGGVNAIVTLARNPEYGIRAAAFESSFASYRAIVRDKIKLIPVLSWFRWPLSYVVVGNRYSADHYIGKTPPIPVAIIHGTSDRVVSYQHALRLMEKASANTELWTVDNGDHVEAFTKYRAQYAPRLVDFYLRAAPPVVEKRGAGVQE